MINPEFLAQMATDALLQEVNLAPKPGLVDPISTGAHKDMTKDTFYQSIEALRPYLLAYAEAGSRHNIPLHLSLNGRVEKLIVRILKSNPNLQ